MDLLYSCAANEVKADTLLPCNQKMGLKQSDSSPWPEVDFKRLYDTVTERAFKDGSSE